MADKDSDKSLADVKDQVAEQFTNITQDLFNIEVNTILRDNITAQKMPNPRHALLDIGKEYCAALEEMETWRQDYNRDPNAKSLLFEDDMFDMMRRELGYVTNEELSRRKSIDPVDQDKVVSPKVGAELGGFDAFDVLRNWAESLLGDLGKESYLSRAELAVLPRIKDNADLIKGMYSSMCRRDPVLNAELPKGTTLLEGDSTDRNSLKEMLIARSVDERVSPNTIVKLSKIVDRPRTIDLTNEYSRSDLVNRDDIAPLPLRESDLVTIRKIWELGTEVIAMQTIVQIDGDVITRLNPYFLDEARYPKLHDHHNKGVNIALKHWANLVDVAKELLVATARGISARVSG